MTVNFEIEDHYALKHKGRHIDIHNNFDLVDINYQPDSRRLALTFIKTQGDWIHNEEYKKLSLIHTNVDFIVLNYVNEDRKFPGDDKSLSDITFFPSEERQINDRVLLQTSPTETDDIIYIFQSDFFVRVGCDKLELIVTE